MGLFADLQQAQITVYNRLYLWDHTTQGSFQGYEAQPNNITAVRQPPPRPVWPFRFFTLEASAFYRIGLPGLTFVN